MPPGPPNPRLVEAFALVERGQAAKGLEIAQRVLQARPGDASAHAVTCAALSRLGQLERATWHARRAVELSPRDPNFLTNLGNCLALSGKDAEAVEVLERARALDPAHFGSAAALCEALGSARRYHEQARRSREELSRFPGSVDLLIARATGELLTGHPRTAAATLAEAVRTDPANGVAALRYAACLNYVWGVDPDEVARAHFALGDLIEGPSGERLPPAMHRVTDADPSRRLRVGVLSPDLVRHSVSFFLLPLLEHPGSIDFVGLTRAFKADATTARIRSLCRGGWVELAPMTPEEAAARIASERIDVLVELAGFTSRNAVDILVHRPAPVAVTFLGYPATTGLRSVDYRIVDSLTDPPGSERLSRETLLRTDPCFLSYRPDADVPARDWSRGREGGPRLVCFNALQKVGDELLSLWSRIVKRLPGSVLVLKSSSLDEPALREELVARWERLGVGRDRLELHAWAPDPADHLGLYRTADLALDTYPYHGTTTTCEALWMNVPVVTMAGGMHASRVGLSLLTAVGRPELVAHSEREYEELAVALASDPARLAALGAGLRERVVGSVLGDASGAGARFERAVRGAWGAWCAKAAEARKK